MISLSAHAGKIVSRLRDSSLALLCPQECRVCGGMVEAWRDGIACSTCWQEFDEARQSAEVCAKCGLRLRAAPIATTERRCGRCDDLAFTCARSCGAYEGALRESVIRLKEHPQLSGRIRELLHSTFLSLTKDQTVESVIPVPLHPDRQRVRGFNQAEVIARALTALTNPEVDTVSLVREKKTEMHRAGMSLAVRARSLEMAFKVRAPRLIENRSVLLVDDLMTTGSTAHEIAGTLLAAGARSVSVLTLARAVTLFQ
ncbi:MAG: ComF family protein [Blastocatellia bacterium]